MRHALLLSLAALAIVGCPEEGPRLAAFAASVTATSTTWVVESDGAIARAELYIAETGVPGATCDGTTRYPTECGTWREVHTGFVRAGASAMFGGDRLELPLTHVDAPNDQVDNATTLFKVNDATQAAWLTVAVRIYDADGDLADCAVYGHQPTYFQSLCGVVRAGTPW